MADFYDLVRQIQSEYPAIFALLNKPGVFDAALRIVEAEQPGNTPMTAAQITATLQATPYYQSTPQAGRDFDTKTALDPASARQMADDRAQQMLAWARANGLNLSPDQANYASWSTLQKGYTTPEQWQRDIMTNIYAQTATNQMPVVDELHQQAAQYGVPLGDLTKLDWARQIISGGATIDSFDSYLREQAKSLYPSLAGAIDAGVTVRQYADPYAQIASKELNINPNDFDLTDPKWSAPLNQIDPKTGARTAMTLAAWQSEVRKNPVYGYDTTTGARDQAAQFATQLAQEFGAQG